MKMTTLWHGGPERFEVMAFILHCESDNKSIDKVLKKVLEAGIKVSLTVADRSIPVTDPKVFRIVTKALYGLNSGDVVDSMVFINELKECGVLKDEDTARLDEISKNILVEFKYGDKQANFQLGYNREDGVELIKLQDCSRPTEDFPLVQKLKELFGDSR
jgi:hypothetical protein